MFQKRPEEDGYSSDPVSTTSAPAGETIVGQSVKLEGDFSSDENVRIDGDVSGTLKTSKDLMVGEGASVEADIFAENATIAGKVSGNIDVKNKLELQETARITGDVKTAVLSVAAGAIFSGQCNMTDESKEAVDAVQDNDATDSD
ncbi:polymer-forming cytoskeletal protein [Patescibacteria group bacterium]